MLSTVVARSEGISRRGAIKTFLAASCCAAFGGGALAQSAFPTRPIRVVIPFAAGGLFDALGRPWAEQMERHLGNCYVENIGGGGGTIGAAAVARAEPDGHTLLLGGTGSHVVGPLMSARPSYDPVKDFSPVALLARGTFAVVVNPALPVQSLSDLVQHAKANKGKLSYASAGVGSGPHLAGELFKSLTGLSEVVHVPYKGGGPAVADVVSGHVPLALPGINGRLISMHRTGKLRILAVTSPKRLASTPDIPTAQEAGVSGMIAENFIAAFVPQGTPNEIVRKLYSVSRKAMTAPELRQVTSRAGFEVVADGEPSLAAKFLQDEIDRWRPLIRAIRLKR